MLLPIVVSIPSAAGQNALSNITVSDIGDIVRSDLVGNVTESSQDVIDDSLPLPLESIEDLTGSPLVNASDIDDLVGNVTESSQDVIDDSLPLPLESIEDLTGSPIAGGADETSTISVADSALVNEVELNPRGNDLGEEWIELYNPTAVDINISNFEINPLFQSPTIELPSDAVIEAGETYVIELDRPLLSNTGESLVLANATGDIKDRTPSLVDRSDDDRTWQRIPDGKNEWQFVENTQGSLNDPETSSTSLSNVQDTQGSLNDPDTLSRILENAYSGSDVECIGSSGCFEGVVTRIADGDTLYVDVNGTEYKVDLALTEAPSGMEETFMESTEFTRDLCLGSTVLVDQDDMLLTSNSAVNAVVYCSSSNLNNELLDNSYATLETAQCTTSEFADEPWISDNGC
ncbi:MAG: lamin tail domain-containing protein [Thermoproteota archaeon]|nr:lamin tail domain-containing protein [Thermoproteota archaeon]